jgi:hypothetical protein
LSQHSAWNLHISIFELRHMDGAILGGSTHID